MNMCFHADMPTWESRKDGEDGRFGTITDLPVPESPVWLPNLSVQRGFSPPSAQGQLQHGLTGRTAHGQTVPKPLSPHALSPHNLAGLQQQQQQQQQQHKAGKFLMPKTRDLPAGILTRSPRDASGLFSMSTLPALDVPGMRHQKPKVCSRVASVHSAMDRMRASIDQQRPSVVRLTQNPLHHSSFPALILKYRAQNQCGIQSTYSM